MIDNEILEFISERIEVAVKERFKATNRQIESIQKCIDTLSGDLGVDRKNLDQMSASLASLDSRLKSISESVQNIPKRISDKVNDQAQEVLEATADKVAESVEPVMNKAIKKLNRGLPLIKYPWWRFLNR
jgi:archaellum component FlaC